MNYFKIWPNLDTTIREWVKQLNRLIEKNGNFNIKPDGVEVVNTSTSYGLRNISIIDTAPVTPKLHDLWIDTIVNKLFRWDGSAWIEVIEVKRVETGGTSNQSTLKTIRQTFQGVNINIKFSTIINL